MDDLTVLIDDARWQAVDLETLAEAALRMTLTACDLDPADCEVTLLACDDARIAELNGDFRDKPRPTNVLSWPAEERAPARPGDIPHKPGPGFDGMVELGDIALSFDTCAAEAAAADKPLADHVTHLIVHGALHLLGYDHETEADAALMEGWEVKILGKLGLDDPYKEAKAQL